jgi:hypothetical protein
MSWLCYEKMDSRLSSGALEFGVKPFTCSPPEIERFDRRFQSFGFKCPKPERQKHSNGHEETSRK